MELTSAGDEWVSRTVGGKYRILRLIARGGMGAVYEAQHCLVHRRFAVKFLRRDRAESRDALTRFRREAQAAGSLEHENIAAVVDFGVADDGTPFIVMEYLDGCDLGQLLARHGPLPSVRAADLIRQAALGIQTAHAAGVIHRDLKPQNLFLCRRSDGTDLVKLLDFGIAKLLDWEGVQTRTGTLAGTPAYMSPEQARGETEIDASTDVYALGVIFYELLSGRTPHPGSSANAVLHHIATERALPLPTEDRDVPAALAELVHRVLSPEPGERPASGAELAALLEPFAARNVWPKPQTASPDAGIGGESAASPSLPAEAVLSRPSGRRAKLGLLGGVLLVALAITLASVAALWVLREEERPLSRPASPISAAPRASVTVGPPQEPTVRAAASGPTKAAEVQTDHRESVPVATPKATVQTKPSPVPRPENPPSRSSRSVARPRSSAPRDGALGAVFDDNNPYE